MKSAKMLLKLSEFSNIAGYKINIQISIVLLYINNALSEIKIFKITTIYNSIKNMKYLGINLTKGMKELCPEN